MHLTSVLLVLCSLALAAHEAPHHPPAIVPEAERAAEAAAAFGGPTENAGISAVETLGAIDLGQEFPQLPGHVFRARIITLEPGGVVAVHEHRSRPGYAYILEGEVLEHRQGEPEPIRTPAGSVAIERSGVVHWWENTGDVPVRALVVDIVPAQP